MVLVCYTNGVGCVSPSRMTSKLRETTGYVGPTMHMHMQTGEVSTGTT